jgi:hypothetical protein
MPDRQQWSERTLDMPPQDPWADPPTVQQHPSVAQHNPSVAPHNPSAARPNPSVAPPTASMPPADSPFSRGRAQVNPNPNPRPNPFAAEHEPTGTGWPGAQTPELFRPAGWRELRRGGEWTTAALLFAFVCWGIWALSTTGGFMEAVIIFVVSLVVAAGIFALSRLVGRVVLEKQFHRVRRSARGSHLITAVFLIGVGIAHLQQTAWVVTAFNWVTGLF